MPSGLTVEANLAQLWRYFSLEYELFRSVIGWVPRIAAYEVKCVLVEHLHEDMRRTRALRERIGDFGVFAPERQVDPSLANLVRHLLQAPFDGALLAAFYRVLKGDLAEAYRRHLRLTLRLNDAPTVMVLEDHLPRLDRQIAWARALLDGPALPTPLLREAEAFESAIRSHLAALGGIFTARPEQSGVAITGGSSIAEIEAAFAVTTAEALGRVTPSEAPAVQPSHGRDGVGSNGAPSDRAESNGVGSNEAESDGGSVNGASPGRHVAGAAATGAIPEYPPYMRPRHMALEPRFTRQTADRQRDEPWSEEIITAAAYTHFTELPVIDICAAIVYDGRDVDGLGADRGGDELGNEAGVPDEPEQAAQLADAREKYARAVRRAQDKRARGDGLRRETQVAGGTRAEMPFDFFCDFLRQTWDEVRHSRMGFERLQALGIDPYQVAIPVGHYLVWGNVHLRDRIASLTQVGEACSFKGKREWVAIAHERGEWLSALEHDYDMVDEKNHVRFGARWLPEILRRLDDPRTPEEVVQDADWTFRRRLNAVKRDLGEAWRAELGHRFLGCGTQTSDVTLAPEIIA
jgi:hypothetical protein